MKLLALACVAAILVPAPAQLATRDGTATTQTQPVKRIRLYLKDGSYQLVTSYSIAGDRVRYVSAERDQTEEVPLRLVDLDRTKTYDQTHGTNRAEAPTPVIDPELAKEEAERATLAPEVAPDLHLVPEDSVLAEDTYRSTPELVPLTQTDGQLLKSTGHDTSKGTVDPRSIAHGIVVLKGEKAAVQLHVDKPEFYLRLDDAQMPGGGSALTVDTHGASARATKPSGQPNDYVVVRVDVRQDARVVASFNNALLGTGKRQDNVFETEGTVLPGAHWLKIIPHETLLIGEYALVEILGERTINLGVWDFGIHPTDPENRDIILPEPKRKPTLTPRP